MFFTVSVFGQCLSTNYIVKSTGAGTTCSQLFDNGTWGNFGGSGTSYYALHNGGGTSNPKFGFNVASQGGYGSVTIQGGSGVNYPTLGFSFANTSGVPIMGAVIDGVETGTTAGSESMDLSFYTKPATTSTSEVTERMRITSLGKVGVGLTNPTGTVDIYRPAAAVDATCIALNVRCSDKESGVFPGATAILGKADNSTDFDNTGVSGIASGAALNVGIYGDATVSTNASNNFGVWGNAGGATVNYGVYGSVAAGAGGRPNNCAGYFSGDVLTSSGNFLVSDEKFKTNVKDFTNALSLLKGLQPKEYDYKVEEYKDIINLSEGRQVGIMAQNLQKVFPDLVREKVTPVHYDPVTKEQTGKATPFLAVNYVGLVPVLVQAVKELSTDLDQTKKENAELRNTLNDICNSGCAGLRGTANADAAANQLMQNVPNPFSGETQIGYVLNSGSTANITINALDGKAVMQLPLTAKGAGSVSISGSQLSAGTYTYTLYVDGKVIDTKLMVISASK